jgi:hypothetical protein
MAQRMEALFCLDFSLVTFFYQGKESNNQETICAIGQARSGRS